MIATVVGESVGRWWLLASACDDRAMQLLPDGNVIIRAQKATVTPAKRADDERHRVVSIMVDNV